MSNINFNNPWLLLVLVPFLAAVITPFFIAIKKRNMNGYAITSLIAHILIVTLASSVVAGTTYQRVITETNVYVLADVSYSGDQNLDRVDQYIVDLSENLPKNSLMGIVAFAKDSELLVELGGEIKSVKENNLDNTETNIVDALQYTASLFKEDVIKRIVIISDGKETNYSSIVSVVAELAEDNVYVDAIFLDNNLTEEDKEVQLHAVEYNRSVFQGKKEKLEVMVQSSYDVNGYCTLYKDETLVYKKPVSYVDGLNIIDFDLDTEEAGDFDYRVVAEVEHDYCLFNNEIKFTQSVSDEVKTLFLSSDYDLQDTAVKLYGQGKATVDFFFANKNGIAQLMGNDDVKLPITVEELCAYDQYIFADIDFTKVFSSGQFLESIDTCVSEFGKTLISMGNTYIQTDKDGTDETLNAYQAMLPVKYGASATDKKLVTLIIDISKSMVNYSRVLIGRAAACQILDLLNDNDIVNVINFAGDTQILQAPVQVGPNKEEIKKKIQTAKAQQGTFLSTALQDTLKMIKDLPYENKECFLLSDGLPYTGGTVTEESIQNVAKEYAAEGIVLSTINTACPDGESLLNTLAIYGNGSYFRIDEEKQVEKVILNQVSTELRDSEEEGKSYTVSSLKNSSEIYADVDIENLEKLRGFYLGKKKSNATNLAVVSYSKFGDERMTDSPLFTYWNYGNGMAYSLSTTFSDKKTWCMNWKEDNSEGMKFLKNLIPATIPQLKQSTPYIFGYETEGTKTTVSVHAPSVQVGSTITLEVTTPKGNQVTRTLIFDLENYITSLDTSEVGKYQIHLKYNKGNLEYSADSEFFIYYPPEYNRFEVYEASTLYYMVSSGGTVSEDGKLEIDNGDLDVATYIYDFTPSFLTAAVVLFVIDVFARKIKWADIKALFKKKA
ncbi:MAG: VWA domain-containing protein [Bacilli bacterium]|nr:VWA domain-containing protein [Bacilli bacterium]